VWRRLVVASDTTLGELSDILALSFGWGIDHLHLVQARGVDYGPPLPSSEWRDEDAHLLATVVPRPGAVAEYTYDLGDNWRHRIDVEEVLPAEPDALYPRCLGGRGLPPQEDTGEVRPGSFGKAEAEALDRRLRKIFGAVPGDTDTSGLNTPDALFAGLFPEFGIPVDQAPSRDTPVSAMQLARQAAATPLARRALALARWVGEGRTLTPSTRLLRPAEAQQAAAELGLEEPVLPSWTRSRLQENQPISGRTGKIRSAKDLPGLHATWTAAVDAGLIGIRGSKTVRGQALALWEPHSTAADPAQLLESWCALVSSLLRLGNTDDRGTYRLRYLTIDLPTENVLPATGLALYKAPPGPVPAAQPALDLATHERWYSAHTLVHAMPHLLEAVDSATGLWALAGIITPAAPEQNTAGHGDQLALRLHHMIDDALKAPDHPEDEKDNAFTIVFDMDDDEDAGPYEAGAGAPLDETVQIIIEPLTETVRDSPLVQMTELGRYALGCLLTAHVALSPYDDDDEAGQQD
jgi:hypothetical protein